MSVICLTDDDEYRSLAADIAADRDDELVESLDGLSAASNDLFVCPATELHESELLEVQQHALETGTGVGIITGRTVEEARELYEYEVGGDGDHGIVLRMENRSIHTYDDDSEVLVREDATGDRIGDRFEEYSSLSMLTNGRTIHSFLTDGYLCGFPTSVDVESFDGPQPHCVTDGERDCPLDGTLVAADDYSFDNVFLNSCSPMVSANNMEGTGLPVHVGLSLLRGSGAVIAGYRPYDGQNQEMALHYAMLRAGYTAAERCDVLNRNAHAGNIKSHPFCVFGRPEVTTATPVEQQYEATVTTDDGRCVLDVTGIDAHVIDVSLDRDLFDSEDGAYYVRNLTDEHADAPLFFTAYEEDETVRVLVYSWGAIRTDRLRFVVDDDPYSGDDLAAIHRAVENGNGLEEIGFLDRKAKGQLEDLENQIGGFAADVTAQRSRTNAYREVRRRVDTALDSVDRIQERIRQQLNERGPGFLSGEYAERTLPSDVFEADEPCEYCGRPVFVKRFQNLRGNVTRDRGMCPRCLNIFDVPRFDETDTSYPTIDKELMFDSPVGEVTFDVTFENPHDVPLRATYFPWLHSDNDAIRGNDAFEPDAVDLRLEPNERGTASFVVDTSELPTGEHPVYAYVVGNLDVYLGVKTMVIGHV